MAVLLPNVEVSATPAAPRGSPCTACLSGAAAAPVRTPGVYSPHGCRASPLQFVFGLAGSTASTLMAFILPAAIFLNVTAGQRGMLGHSVDMLRGGAQEAWGVSLSGFTKAWLSSWSRLSKARCSFGSTLFGTSCGPSSSAFVRSPTPAGRAGSPLLPAVQAPTHGASGGAWRARCCCLGAWRGCCARTPWWCPSRRSTRWCSWRRQAAPWLRVTAAGGAPTMVRSA